MENVKLEYRKALENDVEFLLDLRRKTMDEHYKSSNLPATKETNLQRVLYEYDKAHVIMLNNEPVGLLKINRAPDKMEIIQLQILPELQGKGIGRNILKNLLDEAALSQQPVFLSVLKTNKAQHLYSDLGFIVIDENEHSYFMEYSKKQQS